MCEAYLGIVCYKKYVRKRWKYEWLNILANTGFILIQHFSLDGLPLVQSITFFEWNLSRGTRSRFCRWRRMFTRWWELPDPEFPVHRSRSGVGAVTASVGATTTTTATATTACRCHARTPTHSRLQKQDRQTFCSFSNLIKKLDDFLYV